MKKRIALITHEYYPVLCGGTVFAEKLAIELFHRGYDVEILTCGVGSSFLREEKSDFFTVRRFWTGRKSKHDAKLKELLGYFIFGLPQMIAYVSKQKFDLLFPVFVIPSGFLALFLSKLFRIPSFVFVDAADTPGIQSAQQKVMKFLKPIFKWVTRFSTGVIVLQGLEDVALPQISNLRTVVIPNGTSIPMEVAKPGTHGDVVQFLSIGRLVLRKGFLEIIQALALVREQRSDFHLRIVGYGTKEDEIRKLLEEYHLQSHVTLIGRVEYEKLKDFYLSSDYYLFYGAREGSSLAMIEALSYGLPILASDDLGTRAYVQAGQNGYLVEHLNPEKLSQAILNILSDKSKIRDFGQKSREHAMTFSWANIARQYDEFFQAGSSF
jgi:glycogen(starch) synthase